MQDGDANNANASAEIVVTEDGSITCRDPHTNELYHNRAGAFTEALVNYVEPLDLEGLCRSAEIVVLDVCFGLGYNTWVFLDRVCEELARTGKSERTFIRVTGLEIDAGIIGKIPACLGDSRLQRMASMFTRHVHRFRNGDFGVYRCESGGVKIELNLIGDDLRKMVPRLAGDVPRTVDVVFHDPFSPAKVPELWTTEIFGCYRSLLRQPTGRVVTYSAATAVRSGFIEAGFDICRTTAVGRKSGGTMAFLSGQSRPQNSLPLAEEETLKLKSASAVPYRDETFSAERLEILKRRELEQLQFKQRQLSSASNQDG